jgi:curved DNA-binding protein CbpA
MAKTEDYYFILQVSSDASTQDIKASFRRLARQYHPDLNPDDLVAAEKFKLISQAYNVLSDTTKLRRYDRELAFANQTNKTKNIALNSQDYYFKGVQKSQQRQYQRAIDYYTKAIELDANFVEAYLKRCEMRYKLGDNQGVLEDCSRVLEIDGTVAKAHYYQGRARYRLGYTQSAIDSYTQAIRNEKSYAQAYYYRGIAYRDLKDSLPAVEDLHTAAELFRLQGNHSAYRLTRKNIQGLNPKNWQINELFGWSGNLLSNVFTTLGIYLFNPGGGLLPAFARLEKQQAMEVGIIYAALTDFFFLIGIYMSWTEINFPWLELLLIGSIPFFSLIIIANLMRNLCRGSGGIEGDIFIVGAALIPLGLMTLILGFIVHLSLNLLIIILLIYGFCYSILTLYSGCTQLWNISETKAALIVPSMLIISGSLVYVALSTLVIPT